MAERYYTLAERADNGRWYPQYGSYQRDDVVLERETYRGMGCKAKDLKIITSNHEQADINAAIAKLNRG